MTHQSTGGVMTIQQVQYENLLTTCSNYVGAIALLKQHRPYLEAIPSMRRPKESVVTIPLPVIRVRNPIQPTGHAGMQLTAGESVLLPCDVALLMCDPEWKIKTGIEICVFIHRPNEDFSDLLMRWRQTQILFDRGYEWLLPARYQYLLSEGADIVRPLFVVFPGSPERISKGLKGAGLPAITYSDNAPADPTSMATSELAEGELDVQAAETFDFADLDDIGSSEMTSE
ncbi:hypothetical protein PN498_21990 [Oscillatoria sp. CS-180]|uniref:hypothetical protein n=1 Tax=Oscillatoria sp. CS-180 TaxID=3021720 RepID=UPI00232EFA45|nr:hypothetical protein [Oscillatoria sp. CS-180]MDB9528679.1 hypothetical protein [Oscillatoria sp. CS-180]